LERHEPILFDADTGWTSTARIDEGLLAGDSFACVDRDGQRARAVLYRDELRTETSYEWVPLAARARNRGLPRLLHHGSVGPRRFVITEPIEHRRFDDPLPRERAIAFARDVASALLAAENHAAWFRVLSLQDLAWTADERLVIADAVSLREENAHEGAARSAVFLSADAAAGRAPTARSHVWVFAPIVFTLLTGSFYFTEPPHVTFAQMLGALPLPTTARGVPLSREFEHWVLRCLAPDPAHRFDSVRDAYFALAAALNVPAPPLDETGTRSMDLTLHEPARVVSWESAVGDWVYGDVGIVRVASSSFPNLTCCASAYGTVRWLAPVGSVVPAGAPLATIGHAQ
jgi:hypothetical protein